MFLRQIGKAVPKRMLLFALCLFLLTACGSTTGASSGASATATTCARMARSATSFQAEIGTLKSINGKNLVLTTIQGKSTTVTYASSTTFTQEARITASALKEGTPVSVIVTSTGSTYTAVSVVTNSSTGTFTNGGPGASGAPGANGTPVVINGGPGSGGPPGAGETPVASSNNGGGSNPCSAKHSDKNAPSGTSNTNAHALIGTVSQVNGTLLTIADPTGASYTVTLTAQTQIIRTQSASAAALKVGEPLTVVGKLGSPNTVAASTIEILLSLPERSSSPIA